MLRHAVLSALGATVLLVPAARADDTVYFNSSLTPGQSTVGVVADDSARLRIDFFRDGVLRKTAYGGASYGFVAELHLDALRRQDFVRVYRDGRLRGQFTYGGGPWFESDACAGRAAYTVYGDPATTITRAGAFAAGAVPVELGASFAPQPRTTVTLGRKLQVGDVVYAQSTGRARFDDGRRVDVNHYRQLAVAACDPPVLEDPPAVQPPAVPIPAPAPTPEPPTPTVDLRTPFVTALGTTRSALGKLKPARLARSARVTLTVAAPAAGTTKLRLTARTKGKTVVLGTGSARSAAGAPVKVTVKLSQAGRALLKRSARLKVTLAGTFTPAAGPAVTHSTAVTLKR